MYSKVLSTWSFNVVDMQRTATQCKKTLNARAQPLLCVLNILFCVALVAVAFVDCVRSLLSQRDVVLRPWTVAYHSLLSILFVR